MFRGDPAHRGQYPGPPPIGYGGILWRVQTGGPVRSTPAVADGRVFIGSGDGYVYALDVQSGRRLWRYQATTSVTGSPAVAENTVFVTDHNSVLHALEADSGRLRWTVDTEATVPFPWGHESGDVYASSPVIADSTVYFGAGDGCVYAVDAATGAVLWRAATDGRVRSTPAVAGERLYVGSADGVIYAFSRRDGSLLWRYETEGSALASKNFGFDRRTIQSSPTVVDGRLFVGARDGYLYALDSASGELLWRFNHDVSWVNSSPAVSDGLVLAGSSDAEFFQAVDAATGKERWRVTARGLVWTSPAVVDGRVIVAEGAGRISVLDIRTGKSLWSVWIGGQLLGSPVMADGAIYIGSMDGGIYALRATADRPLLRAVFWDSAYAKAARYAAGEDLRDYLSVRDYAVLDAEALEAFMEARIGDRVPSVIIFALDHVPEPSIAGGRRSTFRTYLDAGGSVVWPSLAPLLWRGNPTTGRTGGILSIDRDKPSELLNVDFESANFDPLGARPTAEGLALGLPQSWLTAWTVDVSPEMDVLGVDEFGRAAAWRKRYGGPPGTGFTRLWGAARTSFDPSIAVTAAELRPSD